MHTAIDPLFETLVDPAEKPEKIAGGFVFTEGPVWNRNAGNLIFSDIYGDTLYVWKEGKGHEVFRRPSGQANGNTLDKQGRLVTCEHQNRRVSRTGADGRVETLAGHYQGKKLNSPNDVVCSSKGDLYFTDPPYGLVQPDGAMKAGELDFCGVFRFSPRDNDLTLLIDDFVKPNGLMLSLDEKKLLVNDTERHHVRIFDIDAKGKLSNGRVLAKLKYQGVDGRPDGMKLDTDGNLYVAGGLSNRVWVFDPTGKLMGLIGFEEGPANLAWGGEDWRTLFVTARTSVFRISMRARGVPVG